MPERPTPAFRPDPAATDPASTVSAPSWPDLHFSILGRTLRSTPLPPVLAALLRRNWHFPEHHLPAAPDRIQVTYGPVDPQPWQHCPVQEVKVSTGSFPVRLAPDGFYFQDDSSELGCRHQPGLTVVHLHLKDDQTVTEALDGALYVALQEALVQSGLLAFHGAAASQGQWGACAFIAPSGTGKSTTLLRAVQAGWTPVAEDTFWLDPPTGLIYGWERHLRLLPESQALLPEGVQRGGHAVTSDGKLNVPYHALPGAAVGRGGVPLRTLAVLTRDPQQPGGWLPLTRHEAALALWEALGLPLSVQARQFVAAQIGALTAALPCVRLNLGHGELPFGRPFPGAEV